MWDDIIELILDHKKAPIWIRILSAVIILAALIGVWGLLVWSGVSNDKVGMILLGVGLFVFFVIAGTYKIIKYRKKK